ncbi:MAG: RluA family pseudouridine synthase [Clostridia bacterium]|jgi:23S rRNA pseudouridine1911/1915/1917 synthase|nr:RluA family pseudouridine synthase [Clostridia bacterium]
MKTEELIILYEDNHIIVVLKPQMVPCCPDESGDSNLFECVKEYIRVTYSKQGNVFLGLVHRLDRPTGGVMVFAKTSKAAARLSEKMKNGGFEKKYYAVLCGVPSKKKALLENYLRKNSVNNMVYVCTQTEEGAKFASLEYEIKEERAGLSLADITLHTGRTHQIRVQTSSINCPVYGDMRYGGEKAVKGKLALWAYSLRFTHPTTGESLKFIIEPPKEDTPWKLFTF